MARQDLARPYRQPPDVTDKYRRPQATVIGPVTNLTGGLGNYTSEENGYRIG